MHEYQVAIVGGGPASLAAAQTLARSRKSVAVYDAAEPRNGIARHSHGFLTQDGTPPFELRRIAMEQIERYRTVEFKRATVRSIERGADGFVVDTGASSPVLAQVVLLAMGMVDLHPDLPGFSESWGKSVLHCPYCHGYEVRDRPWGFYAACPETLHKAMILPAWTDDVIVFADPGLAIPEDVRQRLDALGIAVERRAIRALIHNKGELDAVELEDGLRIPRSILIYRPEQRQTGLVRQLGVELDADGFVQTDAAHQTSIEGIFAAGDLTTRCQQLIFAAASGVRAALAIDHVLAEPSPRPQGQMQRARIASW